MVYHHAQHPRKKARMLSDYTNSGLVPCGSTPLFSLQFNIALFRHFECSILQYFRLFRLLRPSNHEASLLAFYSSNFNRPSLVASPAPSNAPEPLFTSLLCGRCRIHRCHQIPTPGEESLASWNSAPGNALFLHQQPVTTATTGYAASYWLMVCRYWNAQCAMRWTAHEQ